MTEEEIKAELKNLCAKLGADALYVCTVKITEGDRGRLEDHAFVRKGMEQESGQLLVDMTEAMSSLIGAVGVLSTGGPPPLPFGEMGQA